MERQGTADGGRLVAVTGVTGFIGGHLAAELARQGWRVRALVRAMPRWQGPVPAPAEAVLGDLADRRALAELVAGAEAVVHLAGAIKGRSRGDFVAANAEGTAALAAAWRAHAPEARFVHLSSMAAREPGLSHYAASKRAAEDRLREIAGARHWHILRPAAVYGPGDRETLRVFRAAAGPVQPMLNHGEARLTLVHVADLARAILSLLESNLAPDCHEVTDERAEGYGWDEIARAAARALDRPCRPLRLPAPVIRGLGLAGDALALVGGAPMLTSHKAREVLFPDWRSAPEHQLPAELWRPCVPLDEGFAETARWYRSAGWL